MVEGHAVHRIATRLLGHLVGLIIHVSSPNGKEAEGARRASGRRCVDVKAHGKWLMLLLADVAEGGAASEWLCVHFGMAGRWQSICKGSGEVAAPRPTTRIMVDDGHFIHQVSALMIKILKDPDALLVGQDPLDPRASPSKLRAKLAIKEEYLDLFYWTNVASLALETFCEANVCYAADCTH